MRLRKKNKVSILAFILLFVLGPTVYFTLLKPRQTTASWYDDSFRYRRAVNITNSSGSTLTDFQVSFTLDTASLISAGKMQSDCDDIRITDASGNLLPHWIEENNPGCNNSATKIWTKVPSIPTSGATIYVYYGNSSAGNAENGDNVFEFFDDFENYSVGVLPVNAKWTSNRAGTWEITDSYAAAGSKSLKVSGTLGYDSMYWLNSSYQNTTNIIEVAVYSPTNLSGSEDSQRQGPCIGITSTPSNGICLLRGGMNYSFRFLHSLVAWGPGTNLSFSASKWYIFSLILTSTNLKGKTWELGTSEPTDPQLSWTYSTRSGNFFGLTSRSSSNGFDNFRIRKYSSTEPSASPSSTEEQSPAPVAYWKFDEGYGTTANDSAGSNNGTISGATWQTEDLCLAGKCLKFDGNDDYVGIGSTANNIKTVSFWVKPNTTTTYLLALNASTYISASSGTISATGFSSPTIYVNGTQSTTLTANQWQHIVVTTDTGITASAITLGKVSNNYLQGFLDEVKLYNTTRTANQIKADYNAGKAKASTNKGAAVVMGSPEGGINLSEGLVGYWKMDESSGNPADSSGNNLTLTNNGSVTFVAGKFGKGSEHVPTSSQYFSTSTEISGVKTVSFWVNPDSNTNYYISLNGSAYIQSSSGTISATGFTNPQIYINGQPSATISADTWSLVTITTEAAVNASAFNVGKIGSNYFDGTLDEIRLYNRALTPAEVRALYEWAPGPVAHFKLDDGSGTSPVDSSGFGRVGSVINGIWSVGKFGKGIKLDGSGDYIQINDF